MSCRLKESALVDAVVVVFTTPSPPLLTPPKHPPHCHHQHRRQQRRSSSQTTPSVSTYTSHLATTPPPNRVTNPAVPAVPPSTLRLNSNKENAPAGPTAVSSPSRPALGGLGIGKPHTRKPYARTVSRKSSSKAKAKTSKVTATAKVAAASAKVKAKKNQSKSKSATPVPTTPPAPAAEHMVEDVEDELPASPPHSPMPDMTDLEITNGRVTVKIPLRMSRPEAPPIGHLELASELVPAAYIRRTLRPIMHKLYAAASLYRPYPSIDSPDVHNLATITAGAAGGGPRKSFAWGVPVVVEGRDDSETVADAVYGFEPDMCLAIRKRGDDTAPFQLYAVSHLVYSAFCAHFPRLPITQAVDANEYDSASDSDYSECSDLTEISEEDSDELCSESENEDEVVIQDPQQEETCVSRISLISASTTSSTSSVSSATSSLSTASRFAALDTGKYRHLPVVGLEIPCPETFKLLHSRLHFPGIKWQTELLGLKIDPETVCAGGPFLQPSAVDIEAALETRSVADLSRRVHLLHAVWANMVALGVEDDQMWAELASAWSAVVDILARRARQQAAEPAASAHAETEAHVTVKDEVAA